jgi:cytochrome c553
LILIPGLLLAASTGPSGDFTQTIRPVLAENCGMCHNPSKPRNPANFLKAQTAKDIESDRGLWHNVAAQLRNRTMPPVASKLTEEDRLRIATWIDNDLRQTACSGGSYAGGSAFRRLNRREYHNTIRDLLGIDFDVSLLFPADGTGGSGFDTNGETLFVPPVLMERYMTGAQQILDRVIVTPPLQKAFTPRGQVAAGAEYTMTIPVYLDGDYTVVASQEKTETPAKLILKVDGVAAGSLAGRNFNGGPVTRKSALTKAILARNLSRIQVHLTRGEHTLSLGAGDAPAGITSVTVDQIPEAVSPEKRALHYRAAAQGSAASTGVVSAARFPAAGRARRDRSIHGPVRSFSTTRRSVYREHEAGVAGRAGVARLSVPFGKTQSRAGHPSAEPV